MEEKNNVFRQKSLERISSPEELDRYIKTTSPSLWVLLISIIIFLCGIIVWSVYGKIETSSIVGCKVEKGSIVCLITEKDYEALSEESVIEIDGKSYPIIKVSEIMEADENTDNYLLHGSSIAKGEWYYQISAKGDLKDGNYKGKAIYETVSAIVFIFN